MFRSFHLIFLLPQLAILHSSHLQKDNGYLNLDLELHPMNTKICDLNDEESCAIPYTISVLQSPNNLDLISMMMKESMLNFIDGALVDSTIVQLSEAMSKESNKKIYFGIRLFDLPEGSQDYFIIDATNVIANGARAKVSLTTEAYTFDAVMIKQFETLNEVQNHLSMIDQSSPSNNDCKIMGHQLSCCSKLSIKKIHLHHMVCTNLTYLPHEFGVSFTFSFESHVFVSKSLSLKDLPSYCFGVPMLEKHAKLCLKLTDVNIDKKDFNGCIKLDAQLYKVHVDSIKIACFKMKI